MSAEMKRIPPVQRISLIARAVGGILFLFIAFHFMKNNERSMLWQAFPFISIQAASPVGAA